MKTSPSDAEPTVVDPGIPCPHCRLVQHYEEQFPDYFKGVAVACTGCRRTIDWWEAVLDAIQWGKHFTSTALQTVGARLTFVSFPQACVSS